MRKSRSSSSQRRFKDRRALRACTRCRRLKKSCKQVEPGRCLRCTDTDQICTFKDVADDPTAPRPPGAPAPSIVPDSPTNSPSEPPSPAFTLYRDFPSDPSDQIPYLPPHLAQTNNSNPDASILLSPAPSMPPTDPQAPRRSVSSSYTTGNFPSYLPPLDAFESSGSSFDTTFLHIYGNGVYNPPHAIAQPPAPFAHHFNDERTEQDLTDPSHSPHYLRPHINPSPLSISNVHAHTAASGCYNPIYPTNDVTEPHSLHLLSLPSDYANFYRSAVDDDVYLNYPFTPTCSPIGPLSDDPVSSYDLP